jgi:hypothetical protein
VVRVATSRARAEEWAVVLAALDVPCGLREEPDGWTVLVAPADAVTALDALESYEREKRAERVDGPCRGAAARPSPSPASTSRCSSRAVFALTRPREGRSVWFEGGAPTPPGSRPASGGAR